MLRLIYGDPQHQAARPPYVEADLGAEDRTATSAEVIVFEFAVGSGNFFSAHLGAVSLLDFRVLSTVASCGGKRQFRCFCSLFPHAVRFFDWSQTVTTICHYIR